MIRATTALYATAAIAVAAAIVIAIRALPKAAAAAAKAVNPVDPENLANRAANSIFSVAADVLRGDQLGTNRDTIGTWLYHLVNKDDAGKIATATTPAPAARSAILIKAEDLAANIDRQDQEMRGVPLSVDLGEYADTVASDDAYLGALGNGFRFQDTAPAYLNYSAAFKKRTFE